MGCLTLLARVRTKKVIIYQAKLLCLDIQKFNFLNMRTTPIKIEKNIFGLYFLKLSGNCLKIPNYILKKFMNKYF